MSREYQAVLDDREYIVEVKRLDEGGLLIVKVGDQSYTIKPEKNEDGSWTVSDTTSEYAVKVLRRAGKMITVELDGEPRDLEWGRHRKVEAVSVSQSATTGGKKVSGGVYPPMPGKITEVHVSVGDTVEDGQTVCILEAMKMFNELKAPSTGTVKEVNVEPGSTVTTDDLLVLIE